MVRRRTFLKSAGVVVTGLGLSSIPGAAKSSGSRGWAGVKQEPPNGAEVVSAEYPFDGGKKISTGSWINHEFSFLFLEETKEEAEKRLEELSFTQKLDGDTLADPKEYFGEIREYDDEKYNFIVDFDAYTPPQQPGEHTFHTRYTQPNGVSFEGEITYEVTPGR